MHIFFGLPSRLSTHFIEDLTFFLFLDRVLMHVCEINPTLNGETVWIRGRLHTSRGTGKQCFIVVRDQQATIQALVFVGESISKQMVKFCARLI